jgi:hypothetical protein
MHVFPDVMLATGAAGPRVGAMTADSAGTGPTVDTVRIPTLDDIEVAREALRGVSLYTPMEESRWLSSLAGGPVLIKAENLQRTGSSRT